MGRRRRGQRTGRCGGGRLAGERKGHIKYSGTGASTRQA